MPHDTALIATIAAGLGTLGLTHVERARLLVIATPDACQARRAEHARQLTMASR